MLKTGKTQEQLKKIVELFGGPKEEDLVGIPHPKEIADQCRKFKPKPLEQIFPETPKDLLDLLGKIFVILKKE